MKTTYTYNCPKMRLAGLSHFGGIMTVEIIDDAVTITQSQTVPATFSTKVNSVKVTTSLSDWEKYKHMILVNCDLISTK